MAKTDLLVIDIGNTNIVIGVYRGQKLLISWRLSTDAEKMPDEYAILLRDLFAQAGLEASALKGCALSCVVPPLLRPFLEVVKKQFNIQPLVVGPGVRSGVKILTDNPREVGADRIANAVAAAKLHGLPALVIDFGTATTFDAVSKEGDYLGGAIAPGVGIAAESLWRRAAQLPRIDLAFPPAAIGKNTVQAMQSGVLLGYLSMVEGMVERISRELGDKPLVIATGGLAALIAEKTKVIDRVEPNLTLEGLRLIYEMNE